MFSYLCPEMSGIDKEKLLQIAQQQLYVIKCKFNNDLISYIEAADAVISMAGDKTVYKIFSLCKPAVAIPQNQAIQEH